MPSVSWKKGITPSGIGGVCVRQIFSTNNASGICAGYAQTWLTLSLIAGRPVTSPVTSESSIIHNVGQISNIHRGISLRPHRAYRPLGGPSRQTLPESGLEIVRGYPKCLDKPTWWETFDVQSAEPDGYYYLTMKNPHAHAMACILLAGWAYYLDPTKGLFKMPKENLGVWAHDFWNQLGYGLTPPLGCDLKTYRVTQAS